MVHGDGGCSGVGEKRRCCGILGWVGVDVVNVVGVVHCCKI